MTESIVPASGNAPPRDGPRRRPMLVLGLALLALIGAGFSIYWTSGQDLRREAERVWAQWHKPKLPTPEQLAKVSQTDEDRPISDDDSAYWSEVALFRAGPNRPRPVVVVRRAAWSGSDDRGSFRGVITRELFRQALIMSLREGTDAVVRDRMAGDPDEPGTPDATARLGSLLQSVENRRPEDPLGGRITLVEGQGPTRRVLFHRYLKIPILGAPHYAAIVWRLEPLIPTDLRGALAAWKLPPSRTPREAVEPNALADGIEARLASVSEFDQVVGLRALHEDVRKRGMSGTRLFALAHGYAMLGSLIEPLPSACHAALKARSLLYAQRGFNLAPTSPRSFWDQAFAEALSGFSKEANADVAGADKADGGKSATPRDEAIRAFLALNPERLGQLADQSPNDPLPLYLHAVVAQRTLDRLSSSDENCRHELIQAQERLLSKYPECNRGIDNLCEASGVSNLHRSTLLGLKAFAATTSRRIRDLPGLPPAVLDRAKSEQEGPDEVALREALDATAPSDLGDLTWGTLALILRETRFWQVARRIYFEAVPLSSSPSEFAAAARPLVADHPNREYLDLFAGPLDPMSGAKLYRRLDWDGLETKNWFVLSLGGFIHDPALKSEAWKLANAQADLGLIPNLERQLRLSNKADQKGSITNLINFDPASPVARAALVASDWKANASKAFDWEREQPWNTLLRVAIGFGLLEENRFAEAQGRFEAALNRSPEAWIFKGMAEVYAVQGRTDEYIRAAQAMLQQDDQALDHATIANSLAKYLMSQGRVDDAWPWAERAAESWANWTMDTAWKCAEMRRDWANAEVWVARQSQRYGNEWLNWLSWCLRTGHGRTPMAARLVWAQFDAGRFGKNDEENFRLACFGLLTDRPDASRAIAEHNLAQDANSVSDAVLLVLACDRLKERKARDEALDRIVNNPKSAGPKSAKVVRLLVDWDRHRETQDLAGILGQVDIVLAEIPADNRPNTEFVVGAFLTMFDQPTEALPYLKRADVDRCHFGTRLVARQLLADRKEPVADNYFNPPAKPAPGAEKSDPPAEI